jgi:cyclophilin family peptidyl-prolyl cis-trans isomerase
MARTGIPDSATAQFFINVNDNLPLDQANSRDGHGYAVFGKVVAAWMWSTRSRACPRNQGRAPERAGDPGAHPQGHPGEMK